MNDKHYESPFIVAMKKYEVHIYMRGWRPKPQRIATLPTYANSEAEALMVAEDNLQYLPGS